MAKKPVLVLVTLLLTSLLAPTSHAATPKIAILYDLGGRGDGAINDAAGAGVDAAKKKFAINPLDIREMVSDGSEKDRLRRLRFLVTANYAMIIAIGHGYSKSVNTVSLENPTTQFAIIDDTSITNLNVESMAFDSQQSAFLAGAIAASVSKKGAIGILLESGGEAEIKAFIKGAKLVNPRINVASSIPTNPTPNSEVDRLFSMGIDALYSTWTSSNDVVLDLDNLNNKKQSVKLIGVLPEQFFLKSPAAKKMLVGTINKSFNSAIYDAIATGLQNQTYSEVFGDPATAFGRNYDVKNKGISATLTALGAKAAPALDKAKSALLTGKVKFLP